MALSAIEDRYLSALTERDFPTFTPMEAAEAAPEGVDSVQLAAGPSATVSDAGSGMPEMRPTPRNPAMGGVADFVRGVRVLANQYVIKDFVPLLGGMGVGVLLLGKSPEELEEWAYGNAPMRIPEMSNVPIVKTGRKEQLMDTMFLGVDAAGLGKGAAMTGKAAVKNLGPKAAEMAGDMLKRQGLMPGVVPDGKTMAPSPTAPTDDLGFFSAVEQSAMNVQRKSGTGQAFLNDIAKGENVKADEIKWMGLDDFLKGKKNVTREEVQQFIAENRVEVKEVQLGEEGGAAARSMAASDIEETLRAGDMFDDDAQSALRAWMNSQPGSRMESQNRVLLEEKLIYAGENRTVADFLDAGSAQTDATKFGQYTLPGGENYREILLTLPAKERQFTDEQIAKKYKEMFGASIEDEAGPDWKQNRNDILAMITNPEAENSLAQGYKSSHWEQPNVLAHIRVNDRVDADGKKMLLIEEVQSDWHQAGRDKGYKVKGPTELPSNLQIVENTYSNNPNARFDVVNKETGLHSGWSGATPEQARDTWLAAQARKTDKPDAVPDAPMKDTWYQLALKRALKYAADNGYERVGITTGARQAERYDLSKQVDELLYKRNEDGSYQLSAQAGGRGNLLGEAIPESKLSDYVGKEVAKSIIEGSGKNVNLGGAGTVSQPKDMWKSMSGLDLQVGGEGLVRERVQLLDADDGHVGGLLFLALLQQVVRDLARAADHALDGVAIDIGTVGADDGAELALGELGQRAGGVLRAQQALGREDDQRLAELPHHLPAQQVEDLARRGRLHDLHVVVGRQLHEALQARAAVLGALALVAVRQHQRQAVLAAPLHFA
jgi:hypothetical protein